jgi:uncharacterized protein YbjT (DUF2867 family)
MPSGHALEHETPDTTQHMNVLLFGATGMVGDGVLHECLADPRVKLVLAVTRSPLSRSDPRLRELRRTDFTDFGDIMAELAHVDACFFCLGVSAAGLSESEYRRLTHDITLAVASALAQARPGATFCYVSGEGTDSTERGRSMWARVKGETENAILALPLNAWMFRPGFIRPRPGVRSRTALYRIVYSVLGPLYPLLKRVAPTHVTTSENVGRAMIAVAAVGYSSRVLENQDINGLAEV